MDTGCRAVKGLIFFVRQHSSPIICSINRETNFLIGPTSAERDAEATAESACSKKADATNAEREATSREIVPRGDLTLADLRDQGPDQVLTRVGLHHERDATADAAAETEETGIETADVTEEVPAAVIPEVEVPVRDVAARRAEAEATAKEVAADPTHPGTRERVLV